MAAAVWIRPRLVPAAILFVLVGLHLVLLFGPQAAPLPQLAGRVPVPVALLAPALLAVGLLIAARPLLPVRERLSTRNVGLLDRLTIVVPLMLVLLVIGLSWVLTGDSLMLAAARNCLTYTGVGLLARSADVDAASAAPVGYAVLCGLLGAPDAAWSAPLAGAGDVTSAVLALLVLGVGLCVGAGRHIYRLQVD